MKWQDGHSTAWPFAFTTRCTTVCLPWVSQVQTTGRREEVAGVVDSYPFHVTQGLDACHTLVPHRSITSSSRERSRHASSAWIG